MIQLTICQNYLNRIPVELDVRINKKISAKKLFRNAALNYLCDSIKK